MMRDNNNYFDFNRVFTADERLFGRYLYDYRDSRNKYNFLSLTINPVYNVANRIFVQENVTTDGIHFQMTKAEILSGTYFFLSERRIIHSREVYNILDLFAELGGFYNIWSRFLFIIGMFIN